MNPIVLDHGSYKCRAGFAGETNPRTQFLSLTGRQATDTSHPAADHRFNDVYIGDRLLSNVDHLQLRYPVEHGHVTDWDDVEAIWSYVFSEELKVDASEHPILVSESSRNPKISREKATTIMFETFSVPAFCLVQQAVLALYSTGRTSGIVLDSGFSVTRITPVHDGYNVRLGNRNLDIGGINVSDLLRKKLTDKGFTFKTQSEYRSLRHICEKLCYGAIDFEKESHDNDVTPNTEVYQLPDGRTIKLGAERFQCVEVLFQPLKFGFEYFGVHELVNDSITKLDEDLKEEMFSNIVLSGGSTMFPNFDKRLQKEMIIYHANAKINAPAERDLATWRGGAIISTLSQFLDRCISKEEYDEHGPCIVHKKVSR